MVAVEEQATRLILGPLPPPTPLPLVPPNEGACGGRGGLSGGGWDPGQSQALGGGGLDGRVGSYRHGGLPRRRVSAGRWCIAAITSIPGSSGKCRLRCLPG